ncbi:MAG: integrase core domain-containing protein [Candidatus Peregrinibacteria bacterium]
MVTDKARKKYEILVFWEKHGLSATMDAFGVRRRTLFLWKEQLREGGGKPESLNEASRTPVHRRLRAWPLEMLDEIKRLRMEHPNLGKAKVQILLARFCRRSALPVPSASTVGRIIADLGGLRIFPQKVSHFGKVKKVNRQKVLRKPKDFKATHPGHCVALDTIERFINGCRRYVVTFEDIYSRFGFAWSTTSHASKAAEEFFAFCQIVFPIPFEYVLTDNGSEFKKHFSQRLQELHLAHYHTYPRTPKMNAHCERFNRTIQEEFVDYHVSELLEPQKFNVILMQYLVWFNTERPHYALELQSPLQFLLQWTATQQECNYRWTDTWSGKSSPMVVLFLP